MIFFLQRCLLLLALCLGVLPLARAQNALLVPSAAALGMPGAGGAPSAVVQTPQVRAELVVHAPQGIAPGQPVWVGLRLEHQTGWHTYWKNPGDTGLPTQLHWTLPNGVQAEDIGWPLPSKIRIGSLANYGYEGRVLLPVPLRIAPNFAPLDGQLPLELSASWLVCKEECVPQEGRFSLRVPMRGSIALHAADFAAAERAQPQPARGLDVQARLKGQQMWVQVKGLPASWRGKALDLFPETPEILDGPGTPARNDALTPAADAPGQRWQGDVWTARMPLSPIRTATVEQLPLVLAVADQALQVQAPVKGPWPAVLPPPAASMPPVVGAAPLAPLAPAGPTALPATVSAGLWLSLLLALAGGLLLNLMPCVLPVLALKILTFSRPQANLRAQRAEGLAFTAGVLLSFMALGALVLGLRSAGEQLGWGFQLQSPPVVVALAVLFTLIGLNLSGLLELGHLLPAGLAGVRLRHPLLDAGWTGVLAVAVASPCTTPFMGAAMGTAFTLPPLQALAIFAALGLGLALPYLLASWLPAITRWMPRPGAWMETLRRFLAFPMWATVVWLLWVLGHLNGVDAALGLLALLLGLAWLVWSLNLQGRSRPVLAALVLAMWLPALLWWAPDVLRNSPEASTRAPTESGAVATSPTGWPSAPGVWLAWSPEREQAALKDGRTVFVDYTAAWCITCQFNKRNTLSDTALMAELAQQGVVLMRADWTRRDPIITQSLAALGRSGVPVYVLRRAEKPPQVLSEVLSAADLRAALTRL